MKKKVIIGIASILLVISGCLFAMFNSGNRSYEVITNETEERKMNTNALTMMLETGAGSGEYTVASDNTWPQDGYVFNERLSACENGSALTWDDTAKRVIVEANTVEKCYIYFDVEKPTLASTIEDLYTTDGENGLYLHDGQGTYGAQEAGDNSYRFSGANPNNYVCFGPGAESEGTCANDNLYRIIGLFDDDKDGNYQIKLIKSDYTTSAMLGTDGRDYNGTYSDPTSRYKGSMDTSTIAAYRWNYDTSVSVYGSNNWTTSEFNTINLNTNYWNYLGTTWQNLIAETTWHLGEMTSYSNTAKAFYDGERNNAGYGSNPTTYRDEIGLMYVSDYGYAASPDAWATNLGSYNNSTITANNWMYMGLIEWTITPDSSGSPLVFDVLNTGKLLYTYAYSGNSARPVFYLESNVALQGGRGTSSDPYRLAV